MRFISPWMEKKRESSNIIKMSKKKDLLVTMLVHTSITKSIENRERGKEEDIPKIRMK